MAKAPEDKEPTSTSAHGWDDILKEAASQVWLAGVGAYTRAQKEGSALFTSLVEKGRETEEKMRRAAAEKARAAEHERTQAGKETDTMTRAWDKLESAFEARVWRALGRLGVPTKANLDTLRTSIEELEKEIKRLTKEPRAARPKRHSSA